MIALRCSCRVCCHHCGELAIYDAGDTLVTFSTPMGAKGRFSPHCDVNHGPLVSLTGFIGHITGLDPRRQLDEIKAAIAAGDLVRLYEIDPFLVPWYCPECRCCYCIRHWHAAPGFDGGFYEDTRGICPNRHSRLLDD